MRSTNGTLASTCGNDNDVIGGRKAVEEETRYILVDEGAAGGGAVLVDVGGDDAVRFSDQLEVANVTESEDEDEEEEDTDTLDSDSRTELDSDDESDDEEDSLADTLDGSLDDDTAKDSYGSEDDGSVLDRSLDPSVSVAKPRKTSRDRSQRAGEAPHSPDSAGTPATASTGGDSGRAGSARGSGCARQRDVYCKRRGGPERMVVRQHPEEPGPAKPDDVLVRVVVSAVEGAGVRLPSGSRVVAGSLPPDRQACSQIAVIRLPW